MNTGVCQCSPFPEDLVALHVLCLIQLQMGFDFPNPSLVTPSAWQIFPPQCKGHQEEERWNIGTDRAPGGAADLYPCREREERGTSLSRRNFWALWEQSWGMSYTGSCKQLYFSAPSQHLLPARQRSSTTGTADRALPGIFFSCSLHHMKGSYRGG